MYMYIIHKNQLKIVFYFIRFLTFVMSVTLALSGNTSVLTANYFPPISLSGDYECCLVDFHSYNSIPNVDLDNNLFYIGDKIIEVPVGSYELQDIVDYLTKAYETQSVNKSIKIEANNNTLQIEIFTSHDTIFFNRPHSIGKLFGFVDDVVLKPNTKHTSTLLVNILKVNALQIHCNIITGSYVNNLPAHTLHEFALDVPPGYKLDEIPRNLIYLPVNVKEISSLTVWIVDQVGRLINFRGEEITLRLHLRLKKKNDNL